MKLWEFQTGAGMNAPASTFEHEGKQYVVALSAGNVLIGSAKGDSVWLFGLDGTLPPAAATALAEQALSIAPTAVEWQRASQRLAGLGTVPASDAARRRSLLNQIVSDIVPLTGARRLGASEGTDVDRSLRGAWEEGRPRK